jgi:hypothetical protein
MMLLEIMESTRMYLEEDLEEKNIRQGVQVKPEAQNIPSSSLPWSPGAAWTKTNAQVTYGVHIRRSTYVWKVKKIIFSMPLVPYHYQVQVNLNH